MSEQFSCFFPDHEYPGYQTNYDQTYQDLAAYNTGYDTNSLTSAYTSVTEKQDELDMDVSNQYDHTGWLWSFQTGDTKVARF